MIIKSIKKILLENPIKMYDITVEKYHNFLIGDSRIVAHNSSLEGSINKITKDFGNSESMMIGDGFFGSPVKQSAAAARYTSLKINPKIQSIISEYSHLNERRGDEAYSMLNVRVPLGLCNHIIGIAIGWKASILPRKIEEMDKFLQGKKGNLNPNFQNFEGTVEPFPESTKTWIIAGKVDFNDKAYLAKIIDIPPMMQYDKFLAKLNNLIEVNGFNVVIQNNSSVKVNIDIQLKSGDREKWPDFKHKLGNLTKVLITENLVFIKDKQVIEYQSIESYLEDFKYYVETVKYNQLTYELGISRGHLAYNEYKLQFLLFMLEKKRNESEIKWFCGQFDSKVAARLEDIRLALLSEEEVQRTKDKISEFITLNAELVIKVAGQKVVVESHSKRVMIGEVTKNNQNKDENVINSDIELWEDDNYDFDLEDDE